MRPARIVIAAILAFVGAVWFGQGIGLIPGSFMSGDPFWAVIGGALLVVGATVGAAEWRRAHRA